MVRSDRRPLTVDSTPAEPVVPSAMGVQYSDKRTHRRLAGEEGEEGEGATR